MNISLYQAATALEGAQQRQNVIAENLAALGIPGFKRNTVAFHAVNASMFTDAMQAVDKTQLQYMLPRITGHIDFSQGTLVRTSDNTNLAIDGPGFFAINGPNGVVYTRNGSFHVSGHDASKGQLITKEGYPLRQAGSGAPIIVATDTDVPITISRDGMVSQGGAPLGQIELVNFLDNDLKLLKRINSGYYQANGATPVPIDSKKTKVAQGFLEGSNTTPMHEMSELMSSLRHFEANQKIMKIHDEQMGKMIRELGATQ